MKTSILIPWCNRPELAESLRANLPCFQAIDAEVIIINSSGDTQALLSMTGAISDRRIRILTIDGTPSFNKAECINIGADFSRREWLFTLDADIIIQAEFFKRAFPLASRFKGFVTVNEVVESDPASRRYPGLPKGSVLQTMTTTRIIYENGLSAVIQLSQDKYGTRSGPGLVLTTRKNLLEIGGLNSELHGWGFEDVDFQVRLQLGLGLKRVAHGKVLHLSHSLADRSHLSNYTNTIASWRNYSAGILQGTFLNDVTRLKERVRELHDH